MFAARIILVSLLVLRASAPQVIKWEVFGGDEDEREASYEELVSEGLEFTTKRPSIPQLATLCDRGSWAVAGALRARHGF